MPSHNNIQNQRYEKSLLSILMQEYSNYHIVFTDDYSRDSTLKETMKLTNQMNFPSNRITFVQNLRRNFATYNIVNAAFSYCGNKDIMVIVDGDD